MNMIVFVNQKYYLHSLSAMSDPTKIILPRYDPKHSKWKLPRGWRWKLRVRTWEETTGIVCDFCKKKSCMETVKDRTALVHLCPTCHADAYLSGFWSNQAGYLAFLFYVAKVNVALGKSTPTQNTQMLLSCSLTDQSIFLNMNNFFPRPNPENIVSDVSGVFRNSWICTAWWLKSSLSCWH